MKLLIALMTFTHLSFIQAETINFESIANAGITNFEAVGKPAMIKINGAAPVPKSLLSFKDGVTTLEAELDLNDFKTGIDLRDQHMKEKYLEVAKYPKAKLIVTKADFPAGWEKNPTSFKDKEFSGTLQLHGKEAPIKGTHSMTDKNFSEAHFKISLNDFNIEIPNYLGIKVVDVITIKTQIQFEKK